MSFDIRLDISIAAAEGFLDEAFGFGRRVCGRLVSRLGTLLVI